MEGDLEFTGLCYIPTEVPFGLYDGTYRGNFKLYVKRVFITDNFEDFMPRYLSFVKGLVDSDDFDLNISRETLQKSRTLQQIKKKLVRKVIGMFQELADSNKTKYDTFYSNYAQSLKLGILDDYGNRDRLAQLLRYYTYRHQDEKISLDKYIEEMKKNQSDIYFLAGESVQAVVNSPLLERLVKRNYDVVIMTEPMDEYIMQSMHQYLGKFTFKNLGKDLQSKKDKEEEEKFKPLAEYLKSTLSDKVSSVVVSSLLTVSPVALVSQQHAPSGFSKKNNGTSSFY